MAAEVLREDITDKKRFRHEIEGKLNYLVSARPTAVNMKRAADELIALVNNLSKNDKVDAYQMKTRYKHM